MARATTEALRGATVRLWLRRLGWLLGLWCLGVASLAVAALLLRRLMDWAGLAH